MSTLDAILPGKLFQILDRNGISTVNQVILQSSWDIKKLTNLSNDDIQLIKNMVSDHFLIMNRATCKTCDMLILEENMKEKLNTGSNGIDSLLKGGFRRGTITEIYGESGSGKTQIAIQAAVHNWSIGCVYICTEDLFPIKRYEQIKRGLSNYSDNIDYGKHTFIEHITEPDDLITCIRIRLPKLLSQNQISLIVIDSVAGPFRVECTNYIQRAQDLRELAYLLLNIAVTHNVAILCINQVTAAFNNCDQEVIPSLGLAWSNMICTRLWLKKLNSQVEYQSENVNIRELSVEFSPELPYNLTNFIITPNGLKDLSMCT
jgi:RecA/RadA recombinase